MGEFFTNCYHGLSFEWGTQRCGRWRLPIVFKVEKNMWPYIPRCILNTHGDVRLKEKNKSEMWILAVVLLAWSSSSSNLLANACPSECSCSSSGVVVDCSDRGLTQIPNPLPKDAVTLWVSCFVRLWYSNCIDVNRAYCASKSVLLPKKEYSPSLI